MQRILSTCSARPATSDRGAADLKGFAHCRRPLPCDYRSHVGCRNLFCCRLVVFSLLKCVLARSFLDVNFQVTFLTNNYDFGHGSCHFWYPKSVIWQAWCSTLAPWGTTGRSRGTWEQKKGDLGIQAWILIDFGWISGSHFESFSVTLNQNRCFFSCLFPGHFSKRFWGLNLDVWVPKTSIWCEMGCKNQVFIEVGILLMLKLNFDVFGWPWDQFS